jgi:nucleobase:cation symporter-1, NCS1 family
MRRGREKVVRTTRPVGTFVKDKKGYRMTDASAGDHALEVAADRPWSIEQHAIEPIPDADRHGSPAELFRLWIGANMNYVVVLTGALAVTQGLSFWESIWAILIGNLLGCTVVGLSSIMGPKTGSAAIITSRPSFGQIGAVLPIFISTIAAIGWFSINSIIGTQSLIQVFKLIGLPDSPIFGWVAMLIVLVAEIAVAMYGHATIIASEKFISTVLVVMFLGLLVCVVPQVDWAHAMVGRKPHEAHFALWLLVMGLMFSYPISWTNFASDYSRYLPKATTWQSIAKASGGGQFVSLVFCEIIGVCFAMAIGGDLSDPVSDLPKVLPTWYLLPFLLTVIVGSVATNVPNGYTAGLGLLALRLPIKRVTSMLLIAVATLAFRIFTMLYGHALDLYQQWLGYILIWTCPWVAIVIVDYFLRHGAYDAVGLMQWGRGSYWYTGGIYWPGILAFLLGLAASFLFADSDLYASPLMTRYFGGTDLSFESGLIVAGLIYYFFKRRDSGIALRV